jgi:DNA-directed RNA polymerase subunit RPC12/RpoP
MDRNALRSLRSDFAFLNRYAKVTAATGMIRGQMVDRDIHCPRCKRLLAESIARPYSLRCPRCKLLVESRPAVNLP